MTQRSLALAVALLLGTSSLLGVRPARAEDPTADSERPAAVVYLLGHPAVLVRQLHLTAEQATATRALIQTARTALRPIRTSNQALNRQIQEAFQPASPDACAIGALVVQRHGNYDDIEAVLTTFDASFSALLTPDQLAKYDALKAVVRNGGAT